MTPLLYCYLSELAHKPTAYQSLIGELRKVSLNHAANEMARHHEFITVVEQLQKQNLEFLVLKGEALANLYYTQPYMRPRGDIDLFFKDKKDAEYAWTILEALGYARNLTLDGGFVGYQFNCWKRLRSGLQLHIDVHNKINDYLWISEKVRFNEIYQKSELLPYGDTKIRAPNAVYSLIHACLHRINNRPLRTENRLIWLFDIHLICSKLTDENWGEILKICGDKGFAEIITDGILASKTNFGTPFPSAIHDKLESLAANEACVYLRTRRRSRYYLQDLLYLDRISDKFRMLREHLFPSPAYMKAKYHFANSVFLPFYYLKRWFSGLNKYL